MATMCSFILIHMVSRHCNVLCLIVCKGRFNSIELLINMNSFGFIREACHAMGTCFEDKSL